MPARRDRGRRLAACVSTVVLLAAAAALAAAPGQWNFLPANDIGAPAFHAAHPGWDGRGTVVAILDTGIDAFAPGLQTTTTGLAKLIDVRDFSTEGDWETAPAELDSAGTAAAPVYRHDDGLLLRGAHALPVPPSADLPIHVGLIAEKDFVNNSDVHDLNDDGDTGDRFGFIVYQAERATVEAALGTGRGYELLAGLNATAAATVAKERASARVWLVVVDTDGDGDLAGEAQLRDYHVNRDAFALTSPGNADARQLMAWELNVRNEEDQLGAPLAPTVEFHFDDGSHGSHCAGIAAGHGVSGQDGLDGAAPGAFLVSLKIGDNRLAGGATRTSSMKKAYEYAAAFEEAWGIPVVVNMSFGINSVEEGDDAMGGWLDDLLAEHPTLTVCTSAGNEGPGLSSIGIPATAASVIACGAYLSPATGADLYSARMAQATLFNFSSRGGETAKPDIVAPGSALSTVPGFVDGMARFNGTSMASPQTAGAVACLVSAAAAEGLSVHWGMLKRALIAGGTPVAGLGLLDQGGGLVTLESSWNVLRDLAKSGSAHQVLRWDIETACPFQDDGTSDAAYWRTPGGAPFAPETVTFTVTPVFHPDLDADQRDTFFRSFNFKSEADWLKVVSGDRYVRGDMGMSVRLEYDGKQLQEPGVHAARVIASLDGGDLSGLAAREFSLWNSVVIGTPMDAHNGYMHVFNGKDVPQSAVRRHFVNVPAGATALRVRLEVSSEVGAARGAGAATSILDPAGHGRGRFAGTASPDDEPVRDQFVSGPELVPGTWEICVATGITNQDPTAYRLTVSCDGYQVQPPVLADLKRKAPGKPATGELTVTRAFSGRFSGDIDAAVQGFRRTETVKVEDTDVWTRSITLDAATPRAEFDLVMDKKTANLFTDCAVNLLDDAGHTVRAGSFDGLEAHVRASLPAGRDKVTYTLQVVGAFAIAADMKAWGFELEERYLFASPVTGEVKRTAGGSLDLHCGVPANLKLSFADTWPEAPEGFAPFGTVTCRDERTADRRPGEKGGRVVLEVPIRLE